MSTITLRDRLRADTRDAHDAVDAAMAGLDLGRARDLAAFLTAQGAAFGAMAGGPRPAGPDATDRDMAAALRDLRADLAALGRDLPPPADRPAADHPLARRYLWLGSRLGARMLARRHAAAPDPAAAAAGRWLARPAPQGAWPALLADLAARPAAGPEADAVVAATRAWFGVFRATAPEMADG